MFLGEVLCVLIKIVGVMMVEDVECEFNGLFIGLGCGEFFFYVSYYLIGFFNEKLFVKLCVDMVVWGIQWVEGKKELEDNIVLFMEMMGGMIVGCFGSVMLVVEQKVFFNEYIGFWVFYFFSDLEVLKLFVFYVVVGFLGWQFMEVEVEVFEMLLNQILCW